MNKEENNCSTVLEVQIVVCHRLSGQGTRIKTDETRQEIDHSFDYESSLHPG